ncbi:MAG: hypothetical protein JW940_00220 [Polyangiaceae bacterium]|nr:hypothetical protein [Polyangiaceae bacterium]
MPRCPHGSRGVKRFSRALGLVGASLLVWVASSVSRTPPAPPSVSRALTVNPSVPVARNQADPAVWVEDPLFPRHPAKLLGEPASGFEGLSARPGSVPEGLLPRAADQVEKTAAERGGIDPCQSPDDGFGIYERWRVGTGAGRLLVPQRFLPWPDSFDLVLHFAGQELARKEVARARVPFAFLGVSLGRSGLEYEKYVGGPKGLWTLGLAAIGTVRKIRGGPQRVRKIALASWSIGYSGVGLVLRQSRNTSDVDAVILLDGLHTPRDEATARVQLEPFVRFAERAARGQALMFVSYSSIGTDGFASSHESARRLIHALGGLPLAVERLDPGGLELKELFSRGGFHARGYRGGGRMDHCAHLMLYPMLARALGRRWGLSEPR